MDSINAIHLRHWCWPLEAVLSPQPTQLSSTEPGYWAGLGHLCSTEGLSELHHAAWWQVAKETTSFGSADASHPSLSSTCLKATGGPGADCRGLGGMNVQVILLQGNSCHTASANCSYRSLLTSKTVLQFKGNLIMQNFISDLLT